MIGLRRTVVSVLTVMLTTLSAITISHAARGITILVSQNSASEPGDADSNDAAMTPDGRHVFFASFAGNFGVPSGDWIRQIYVRDIVDASTGETTLLSYNDAGEPANDDSYEPSVSADGRFVAYTSYATNLVPGDDPVDWISDVFVLDRDADGDGVFDQPGGTKVRKLSVGLNGAIPLGDSLQPSISRDGKWVAFTSWAPNLVKGDTNGASDVFVAEVATGKIVRVSLSTAGQQGTTQSGTTPSSFAPSLSQDGRYVVFVSDADNFANLSTGQVDNEVSDVFRRDRDLDGNGVFDEANNVETRIVSVGPGRRQAGGASYEPVVSADGRYIAFTSEAQDLVYVNDPLGVLPEGVGLPQDTNTFPDIYLRDVVNQVNTLVSQNVDGGSADGASTSPAISDDAGTIAFYSEATNLVAEKRQASGDIFVRDLGGQHTEMVSISSSGAPGNDTSSKPTISSDGRFVAFESWATNFEADTWGTNVFRHQRDVCSTGEPERGPVSGPVHDTLEPAAGPAGPALHEVNCEVIVPADV